MSFLRALRFRSRRKTDSATTVLEAVPPIVSASKQIGAEPTLLPCTVPWGHTDIYDADPAIHVYPDVTYIPMTEGREFGVIDRYHRVILDTVSFYDTHWGSDRSLELARPTGFDMAADGDYVYCGHLIRHFGHFITDFLPRLWVLARDRRLSGRFLFHETFDIDALFSVPFIGATLRALELSQSDFVKFDRPTRIRHLIVPQPAMRTQLYAHRVLGELLHSIGDRLGNYAGDGQPLYLTKRHVPAVLTMVGDEQAIEEEMAAAGVRIVAPEQLSFAEQIGLFSDERIIFASVGSALHTGALSPRDFKIYGLNGQDTINTNYLLLDRACSVNARYFFDPGTERRFYEQPGSIRTEYHLPDARETARQLLRESGIL